MDHIYQPIIGVNAETGKATIEWADSYTVSQHEDGTIAYVEGDDRALDAIIGNGSDVEKLRRLADAIEAQGVAN